MFGGFKLKFDLPYYAQSSDFTCGPACVLMVMKQFDHQVRLSRALEFEVWRQCNMIGVRGADPYGLSVPLIDAGYDVHLLTGHHRIFENRTWKRRLATHFSREEIDLCVFGIRQNRLRALGRGLRIEYKHPSVLDLTRNMQSGFVPIALVHMGVVHSLDIPHWVVVAGVNEENVVFNDPYPPKGGKAIRLSHVKFQKILDDIGKKIGMSPSIVFVRRS